MSGYSINWLKFYLKLIFFIITSTPIFIIKTLHNKKSKKK